MSGKGTTKYDLIIPQTDTLRLVINVVGGPAALTGYQVRGQVRSSKTSAVVLAEWGPVFFTVDDLNRQVTLEVPDEYTATYDWPYPAAYDIHIEGPAGDRWRLLEGLATLNLSVTREN